MREIRIDYQRQRQRAHHHGSRQPRQNARQPHQGSRQPNRLSVRCAQHPGVRMVLAGTNHEWNTVRYICPMCSAMGLPMVEMATGVVSSYFADRGYGFVDNGGPRIFFHISDLQGRFTPYVGMPVTCRVEQNEKGLIGRQVQAR